MGACPRGMSEPATAQCRKDETPRARTSRPMQPSTRQRCARQSCGALRLSARGKATRFPGTCRTGWTA
eukprot:5973759-Alexandrium_andersonii.AAC.1